MKSTGYAKSEQSSICRSLPGNRQDRNVRNDCRKRSGKSNQSVTAMRRGDTFMVGIIRRIMLFVCVFGFTGSVVIASPPPQSPMNTSNLIQDSGFEQQDEVWERCGNVALVDAQTDGLSSSTPGATRP